MGRRNKNRKRRASGFDFFFDLFDLAQTIKEAQNDTLFENLSQREFEKQPTGIKIQNDKKIFNPRSNDIQDIDYEEIK